MLHGGKGAMTPSTGNQMRWTVTLNRITISLGWNIVGILWDNVSTHQAILYIYIYTADISIGKSFHVGILQFNLLPFSFKKHLVLV